MSSPLDRIEADINPGRGSDGMVTIDRAIVYRLVNIAKAAEEMRGYIRARRSGRKDELSHRWTGH